MAALNRPTKATYEIHEKVTVDTEDNEDHTFCGIMFPVKCRDLLPVDHLVIKSVSVRGKLGPLTVWVSKLDAPSDNDSEYRFRLSPQYWTKIYEKTHKPSIRTYKELVLDTPIRLKPGQVKAIYIHSTMRGDEAIVYDNSYYGTSTKRYEDEKLAIMTGRAHVSTRVFGQNPIWGYGNAWRDRREFVGRLDYGVVYKLWNPQVQPKFGNHFQDGARLLFLCQRRWESPLSMLPDECIFYILNMCRWDWFNDAPCDMKARRKREKTRRLAEMRAEEAAAAVSTVASLPIENQNELATRSSSSGACTGICGGKSTGLDDDVVMDASDADNESMVQEEGNEEEADDSDEDENLDDSDDADDEDWSDGEDQYYRANHDHFTYRDFDSDDENDAQDDDEMNSQSRRDWIRRQFARIHVLRALASMEDGHVTHVQF